MSAKLCGLYRVVSACNYLARKNFRGFSGGQDMLEPNFGSVEVMPQKKTFQELRHHKRLSVAKNTADSDISISSPCRYEPSDSSFDSYSSVGNTGSGSEQWLADLSSPPKTKNNGPEIGPVKTNQAEISHCN